MSDKTGIPWGGGVVDLLARWAYLERRPVNERPVSLLDACEANFGRAHSLCDCTGQPPWHCEWCCLDFYDDTALAEALGAGGAFAAGDVLRSGERVGEAEEDLGGAVAAEFAAERALDHDVDGGEGAAAAGDVAGATLAGDDVVRRLDPALHAVISAHEESVGETEAKVIHVPVCPRCGSSERVYRMESHAAWGCRECVGWFVEVTPMAHELVANVHRKQKYDVYVGRPSKWGNPFQIGMDGSRADVVTKYREWLPTQPHLMRALPELRGKVLGCFCAPLPCHADVLAEMANRGAEGNLSLFTGSLCDEGGAA